MLILVFWAADCYHILLNFLNFCFNKIWGLRTLRLRVPLYTLSGAAFAGDVYADKDYGFLRNPQLNVNLSDNAASTSGGTGGQNSTTPSSASTTSTTASSSTSTTVVAQQPVVIRPLFYNIPAQ